MTRIEFEEQIDKSTPGILHLLDGMEFIVIASPSKYPGQVKILHSKGMTKSEAAIQLRHIANQIEYHHNQNHNT